MQLVSDLYYWTNHVLFWGLMAIRVWAFVDCLTRRSAAFPAVDKLTKPAWAAILLISGFLGYVFSSPTTGYVTNVIPLVTVVVAAVYLADVRPAVREISSGR